MVVPRNGSWRMAATAARAIGSEQWWCSDGAVMNSATQTFLQNYSIIYEPYGYSDATVIVPTSPTLKISEEVESKRNPTVMLALSGAP